MITIDLCNITRDEVLAAIRELDRQEDVRAKQSPGLGRLAEQAFEERRLALATAREIVAVVARGMIAECGTAVRVLPVAAAETSTAEDAEDAEGESCHREGREGREGKKS